MAILKSADETVRAPTGASQVSCYIRANFNTSVTEVPVNLPSGNYVALLTNKAGSNPSRVDIITDSVIQASLAIGTESKAEAMFSCSSTITSITFYQNFSPGRLELTLYRIVLVV